MAYLKSTPHYGFPYISDNEIMSGSDEETAALIIDNQIRAGILGAGGTRVYQNGSFSADISDPVTGEVDVTLTPIEGNPSVQGIANNCLVEVYDPIVWEGLPPDSFYYLYVQATDATFKDATNVNIVASESPITSQDYLFLATVDTTGSATVPTPMQPVLDVSPPGKPTAFNLYQLLNNNYNPFGPNLTQSVLTVLDSFNVTLDAGSTALIQQLNPDATQSPLTIENVSSQPEIASSGKLRFADQYIPQGFAFSDAANTAYQGVAVSIIGALNEILTEILTHINDNHDPHGPTLYQTSLVLADFLSVPRLVIDPPVLPPPPPGLPPGPPGPPPPPTPCEIQSTGELRLCDVRGGIALTDPDNPVYLGAGDSLIGALNELLELIDTLSDIVNGILGSTTPAMSPVVFEIWVEELGLPLHFRIQISGSEDFIPPFSPPSPPIVKESLVSVTGWFYEYHPPAPPLPPSPPPNPYALPGAILVPDPPPDPEWLQLDPEGLPGDLQVQLDGRPTKVKYEPQHGDGIFLRHRYTIAVSEYNGQYGEEDLGSFVFG
jgi:hypothetical protein